MTWLMAVTVLAGRLGVPTLAIAVHRLALDRVLSAAAHTNGIANFRLWCPPLQGFGSGASEILRHRGSQRPSGVLEG